MAILSAKSALFNKLLARNFELLSVKSWVWQVTTPIATLKRLVGSFSCTNLVKSFHKLRIKKSAFPVQGCSKTANSSAPIRAH
ncbi:Uncharacterised protein [Vibrio cholerae]|nr:Uncharacterised protein [Vibrio cholerae]